MAPRTSAASPPTATGGKEGPAHLELDLHHERLVNGPLRVVEAMEGLLRERPVEEQIGLLELGSGLLRALTDAGYSRAERWSIDPGGWVALPEDPHRGSEEPIAHLLHALKDERWKRFDVADGFHVTVTAPDGRIATAVIRRYHRERGHTVSIELPGRRASRAEGEELVRAVRAHLPVLRARALGFPPAR
jgi:hypothetical protein